MTRCCLNLNVERLHPIIVLVSGISIGTRSRKLSMLLWNRLNSYSIGIQYKGLEMPSLQIHKRQLMHTSATLESKRLCIKNNGVA